MKILVTGCAGFIGSHVCEKLLKKQGVFVIGVDNYDPYYDVDVKINNVKMLQRKYPNFEFIRADIRDMNVINEWKPKKIIHLASMAGVRNSIKEPELYFDVNVKGFIKMLEESAAHNIEQIVYASSSSVYGLNDSVPFKETDQITRCNSPYACSKMSMELLANTYSQLYNLNLIGLRFFTVYGPRGRPDMAPYKFLTAIMNGKEFKKYGDGSSMRDYTYIDDIVDGILKALDNEKKMKCEVYNLGNSKPVTLNKFIKLCEKVCGKKAKYEQIEEQLGDVPITYSSILKAKRDLGYFPKTDLETGLREMRKYLLTIDTKKANYTYN